MEKRGIIQKTYPQPPTNRNYVEHYGNIIMDDPKYPGDYKILLSHIEKMEQNASKGIGCCGRALIGFTVNEFGDVTNIKVFRSDNREVKNEAIRIVKNMKKWKPGIQLGKPVSVKYMMPFEFK